MSNSSLICYTKISPNCTKPRKNTIKKITIHHMAGNLSVETCGSVFAKASRKASSNYGIGTDGRIGMYVEEKNRAWTSSSPDNDNQAITIEVANDTIGGNWHVSDAAFNALINLCVDICKRNNIAKLNYTGNKSGNLTMHKWFANTNCPGPYLESKFAYIAEQVNSKLNTNDEVLNLVNRVAAKIGLSTPSYWYDVLNGKGVANASYIKRVFELTCAAANKDYTSSSLMSVVDEILNLSADEAWLKIINDEIAASVGYLVSLFKRIDEKISTGTYKVKVTTPSLNIRSGPGMANEIVGTITDYGIYTIVAIDGNWGKLKSGIGWIYLKGYTTTQ